MSEPLPDLDAYEGDRPTTYQQRSRFAPPPYASRFGARCPLCGDGPLPMFLDGSGYECIKCGAIYRTRLYDAVEGTRKWLRRRWLLLRIKLGIRIPPPRRKGE